MLILTRRIGESLVIGDNVTMTVLGIKGGQVRLGINAPMTVSIHREEIYAKIKSEQEAENSKVSIDIDANDAFKENNLSSIEKKEAVVSSETNENRKWHKPKKLEVNGKFQNYHGRHMEDQNGSKKFYSYINKNHSISHVKHSNHSLHRDKNKAIDYNSQNLNNEDLEDSIGNI